MRIGRVVAALVSVPLVGGAAYAALLTYQVARMRGGPTPEEIAFSAVIMGGIALVFATLVLLPLSFFLRRSAHVRPMMLMAGTVIWFAISYAAFAAMGDAADRAASSSAQALIIGVPMITAYAAIFGRGPHA